jgi:hypothetical protein
VVVDTQEARRLRSGHGATSAEGGPLVNPSPRREHAAVPHAASRVPVALPLPAPRRSSDGPGEVGCIGPAWIVREVTHVPGVLRLAEGRLCFTSSRGPIFDLDLAASWDGAGPDLALDRRGRGFRITVGSERLHVHVVRPLGAVEPGAAFVDAVARASDLPTTLGDVAAGDVWRSALLSGSDGRSRRPAGRFAGRARRGSAGSTPRT